MAGFISVDGFLQNAALMTHDALPGCADDSCEWSGKQLECIMPGIPGLTQVLGTMPVCIIHRKAQIIAGVFLGKPGLNIIQRAVG